jgi:nucleotide-binding universal stress UspA family protein
MKQIQKILFPINFAERFEHCLPWVSTFVEKFGATLYVLFVTQDLSDYSTFYVPHTSIKNFQDEALEAAKKKMDAVAKEHFKNLQKLETRVAVGAPAEKILEVASQEKIDLIIMGTHGRKGLETAIFGSVARDVVQKATCPVLTLRT